MTIVSNCWKDDMFLWVFNNKITQKQLKKSQTNIWECQSNFSTCSSLFVGMHLLTKMLLTLVCVSVVTCSLKTLALSKWSQKESNRHLQEAGIEPADFRLWDWLVVNHWPPKSKNQTTLKDISGNAHFLHFTWKFLFAGICLSQSAKLGINQMSFCASLNLFWSSRVPVQDCSCGMSWKINASANVLLQQLWWEQLWWPVEQFHHSANEG